MPLQQIGSLRNYGNRRKSWKKVNDNQRRHSGDENNGKDGLKEIEKF